MKKILAVLVLGGALLALFLVLQRSGNTETIARDPSTQSSAATATSTPAAATAVVATATVTTAAPATATPSTASPPSSGTTGDTTACAKLAELCSTSDKKVDVAECEKELADARKMSGAANVERSEQCLADAKTCAAASGCISGGVGMGAMGEFLKGLGSAISR
jgi:hypothetical protein